ncbi:heme exporter protein CcmD [Mameliella sediminis]|uniref:heme exporter protein CcmD n=1 Tax=Mameliella sediminis TaxID=2836866 RepID=UPI001C43B73C|nr:heme exporter protein CcmD [Mameliella sediminis]MBY6116418.1 heme exporter protein CcmD [Antarctobacter heliothermus]MBY6145556.1 heme exporter protein CcmD [Mameliella alba]MBV7393720.1 heme exporter protein CcmD [Mameliella sediminis]MBY6160880.1 heme exporter protein CcmD [Mameliella alba]MBY6169350.1 heme exporter protein CcmD [Mameliella alba]
MMPELGKYAGTVLSSYAVSLLLLVVLIVASVWRSRRIRAELERIEERQKNG